MASEGRDDGTIPRRGRTDPLRGSCALSEELEQYYQKLADRMATLDREQSLASQDYPEDRMYM